MNKPLLLCLVLALASAAAPAAPPPRALPDPAATPAAATLDAAQLRALRNQYAQWQALPEAERARIREAAQRVAALPAAQQQTLRATFAAQDQRFREGWRLGPSLGAQFPKLQGLFGYLPLEQRDAALATLRQLSVDQMAQLTLVAQRTPPQEREQVRSAFLGLAPADRDRWLREHVVR